MDIPKDSGIYFIRHAFDSQVAASECEKNSVIAIHFYDDFPQQPPLENKEATPLENREALKYYNSFIKALTPLRALGKNGGVVVIEYTPRSGEFFIGRVDPNTEIIPQDISEKKCLKTLHLADRIGPLKYSMYPLLSALRPPYQTMSRMYAASEIVCYILNPQKYPMPFVVKSLHPKALEQMCAEWLRTNPNDPMKYEVLKTGKTLAVIDIYGVAASGINVFAQITHEQNSEEVKRKFGLLLDYVKEDNIVWFFGPKEKEPTEMQASGVKFKSIEDVFTELKERGREEMLKKMIGLD